MMIRAASLLALVAYVAAQAADPSINTPAAVVQCQPAQITFTATRTPVFISIIPGGQPSAAPLQDLGQQNASPFTWVASIAQGTSITFQIRDSSGAVAYSAPITIQNSGDASCLGAGASTTAAGTSAPATSAVASSSVASASATSAVASVSSAASSAVSSVSASVSSVVASATSRATATSPASSTRAATATSATPSASAPATNGAVSNAKVGLAGLLGLAAAVVMA